MSSRNLQFVHCNRCLVPLSALPTDSAHRPFTVTNCGHIFCAGCFDKGCTDCSVCGKSGVRGVRLETPLPDYVKRLFSDFLTEFEAEKKEREGRNQLLTSRLSQVALTLKTASDSLIKIVEDLGSASESRRSLQSARFQSEQWRSLASANLRSWEKARKARAEADAHKRRYEQSVRESEEERNRLNREIRQLMDQLSRGRSTEHVGASPRTVAAPTASTRPSPRRPASSSPRFFDITARSPFFRKISASAKSVAEDRFDTRRAPEKQHLQGREAPFSAKRSASPFQSRDAASKKRCEATPEIFSADPVGFQSPFFSNRIKRK